MRNHGVVIGINNYRAALQAVVVTGHTNAGFQVVEDTASTETSVGFFIYAWDVDGDMLQYTVTALPSHGTLVLNSTAATILG